MGGEARPLPSACALLVASCHVHQRSCGWSCRVLKRRAVYGGRHRVDAALGARRGPRSAALGLATPKSEPCGVEWVVSAHSVMMNDPVFFCLNNSRLTKPRTDCAFHASCQGSPGQCQPRRCWSAAFTAAHASSLACISSEISSHALSAGSAPALSAATIVAHPLSVNRLPSR